MVGEPSQRLDLDVEKVQVEEREQEKANAEGTLYQSHLGGEKAIRKHFFSPLDPAFAEAVHKDAEGVQYTEEEEVSARRNIDQQEAASHAVSPEIESCQA